MKRILASIFVASALSISIAAQTGSGPKQPTPQKPAVAAEAVAAAPVDTSLDLAKATLAAHGGEKLKKLKSLVIKGSVDMNVFNQQMPGAFSTAIAGEKYYFEINSMQSLKQVYDGQQTYSSIQGFSLPPITSLGFPVLCHIGDTGYAITALPEGAKKRKGFRITTPEGFYTDFLIEDKTGQIKGYESSYEVNGRVVTTSVEVDKFQTIEGVVVPSEYSQRFDLGQMTAYANFKSKTILVNSTVEDSAFAIPK